MTYSTELKKQSYRGLDETLERLTKLAPGDRLVLENLSGPAQGSVRFKLYNWMHHNGIKENYKIITERGRLIVVRKGVDISSFTVERGLSAKLDKIFQQIIPLADPLPLLSQLLNSRELTGAEVGQLLEKYNQLMK